MSDLLIYIHDNILIKPAFHVGTGIVYLLIIYLLFYFRKNVFLTSDQSPELLHFMPTNRSSAVVGCAEVKTGLYIKSFPVFDFIQNNFVMDALIWFKFNPSLVRLETIDKFSFERCTELEKSEPEIQLEKDYLVVTYNIKVTFSNNLDFLLFPMDDHRLYIVLENEYASPEDMIYSAEENHFAYSDKIHTTDWNLVKKTVESGYSEILLDPAKGQKTSHPRVVFSMDLALSGLRKAALIFLPIVFILFTGTFSLTLEIEKYARPILSLAVGSLTGLLAYRFVIEKISPRVGYFTMAEIFYTVALGLGFITFIVDIMRMIGVTHKVDIFSLSVLWYLSIKIIVISTLFYLLYLWDPLKNQQAIKTKKINHEKKLPNICPKLTLSQLENYAAKVEELPNPNNANWHNPDYSEFNASDYKHLAFKKWLSKLSFGLYKDNSVDFPTIFTKQLMTLIKQRAQVHDSQYFIKPVKNSKMVVFGDIHGAFHSLVRDLKHLQSLNIIDENLKITASEYHLIFNGNVVDGSPYVLETLSIVLTLMVKNPEQVIYLQGPHEHSNLWHSYQTYTELKIKTAHLPLSTEYIAEQLSQFFKTLPCTVYVEDDVGNLMRISHFTSDDVSGAVIENDVLIMIQGLKRMITYQLPRGLELLTPENGITKWSMISCPTNSYRHLYNFDYDTFLIVHTHGNIKQWVFKLYDQQDKRGYEEQWFNAFYGMKIKRQTKTLDYMHEFKIGSTLDLSKTSAVLGERLYQGLSLGIAQKNAQGGIHHMPIRHIVLDDQYTPYIAKKNVMQLREQFNTDLILSPVGTPTTEAYLPLIKQKQLLVLFPYSGATIFRNFTLDHIINLRASYATEAKALVQYAVESLGVKRFVLFYQNDSYGLAGLEGARQALENLHIKDFIETTYHRNNPNLDLCVEDIIKFNPSGIFFFSTPAPSRVLIQKLGVNRLAGIKLLGISFLTDVFRKFLNAKGLELIISRVMPDINDLSLPLVAQYHAAVEKTFFGGMVSEDAFEGYINATLLTTVLESMQAPFTKEKLIAEFEAIQKYNFKGMELNFDPITRELYNKVWIDTGHKLINL